MMREEGVDGEEAKALCWLGPDELQVMDERMDGNRGGFWRIW